MLAALVRHGDGQRIEATLWDKLLEAGSSYAFQHMKRAGKKRLPEAHMFFGVPYCP